MACDHAPEVFVHDKHRMFKRIQQNGVGSFGTDAGQRQQLSAELSGGLICHLFKRAAVMFI